MLSWGPWKKKSKRPLSGKVADLKTKSKGNKCAYSTEKQQTPVGVLPTHFEDGVPEDENDTELHTHGVESHLKTTTIETVATSHERRHSVPRVQQIQRLSQQQNSSSSLIDSTSSIEEHFMEGYPNHRPRVWSCPSDASPPSSSSYQTPCGSMSTLTTGISSELLQSMKSLLDERLTKLEKKMEESQRQLEAKVDDIEQRLQTHIDEMTIPVSPKHRNGVQAELPAVTEVSDEDSDDSKVGMQSSSLQGREKRRIFKIKRVYTDSEAMKMAQQRRQEYAKRKYRSLQDSMLLPKPCHRQVIVWLTQRLTNWKFIARWLGLQENDISRIEIDHQKSDREQCYQMFLRWRETDPENYTYPVLGQALKKESLELYNEYVREVHRVENNS